ncbi:MAG: DUF3098 domain-containing protein [Bacteroidota bacterium]
MSKRRKNKPKTATRRKPSSGQTATRNTSNKKAKTPETAKVAAKRPETNAPRAAAVPRSRPKSTTPLVFGRDTYIWLAAGFGLILVGLLLMSGGGQPDPNEWDTGIIYSFRRITLAPLVMLAGVGVAIYAVLKK